MDQLIKARIYATSQRLCSEKLLRLSIILTSGLLFVCAVMFGYMGLVKMAWIDLCTATIAALCLVFYNQTNKAKATAWILATSLYLCLTIQLYLFPEYIMELGISLSFVGIVMATSGAVMSSVIWMIAVLVAIGFIWPDTSRETLLSQYFFAYSQMKVFSLGVIVSGFAGGGIFLTQQVFSMHRKIYTASCLDSVTLLPNRVVLEERLESYFKRYQTEQKVFHVLFVDAEQFNRVNELFGHDVGDKVLRQMGQKLQKACIDLLNEDVEVFRFDGDEFVVTIPQQLTNKALQQLVTDLQNKIGSEYKVDDYELHLSMVIGTSTSGKSARSARDLLRFADMAMYSAKRSDFSHASYQENDISDWDRHFIIHQSLMKALGKNELKAVIQPVYEVPSKRLIGGEMLIRWNSAEHGPVPPDEFIAVAEASGLINNIGQFIFDEAIKVIKDLSLEDHQDFKIAINVSPYQLKNKRFSEYVSASLAFEPSLLNAIELEITESSAFVNSEHATQILLKFRDMGLRVALDDYGTGATSFMNLQQGAFTRLKLDKSLVDEAMLDEKKHLVIKAAVDSAHSLGLEVTAEGVEVIDQYDLVKSLGCSAVQGYLFSKPLEIHEFIDLFNKENAQKRYTLKPTETVS